MTMWDAARVIWLIVGTCVLGIILGALTATVADWRDAARSTPGVHTSRRDRRARRGQ